MNSFYSPSEHIRLGVIYDPCIYFRPDALNRAARWFCNNFSAKPFYSVKANPNLNILKTLWHSGIRNYDVASIREAREIHRLLPESVLGFLHPVKNEAAIKESYHDLGCKIYALDSFDELEKILDATANARDLTLIVRHAVANNSALLALEGKFGANLTVAPKLLRKAKKYALRVGLSFHVGSQAMTPQSYVAALDTVRYIIDRAGFVPDIMDIGGGFPAMYSSFAEPPNLNQFALKIEGSLRKHELTQMELWCEPGRALVADSESLLTRVEHVTDDAVFINDGIYGTLHDAGETGWRFPYRVFDVKGNLYCQSITRFRVVYGPSCDSADRLHSPIALPETISTGDYIEFGCIGAYGRAFSTGFNGFGQYSSAELKDDPWPNIFDA